MNENPNWGETPENATNITDSYATEDNAQSLEGTASPVQNTEAVTEPHHEAFDNSDAETADANVEVLLPPAPAESSSQPPTQTPYQAPYQSPYQNQYQPPAPPQAVPQWGYQQPPYGTQTAPYAVPQPAPKKMGTGAKVMLICLWVLLGLFSIAIIGVCGFYIGNKGINIPHIDYDEFWSDEFTTPIIPDEDEDSDIPKESNPAPSQNDNLYDSDTAVILNDYPKDQNNTAKYNTKSAFEKVSPSTVGIMCYSDKDKTKLLGQGTGIIINKNGYIATNSHVIGDTKGSYISVVLDNGNSYNASVVGYDTRTDLAVIKISASGLTPAEFADSKQISIGEDVIAVGNPGGIEFQNTLTRGVISATDRTLGLSTQVSYIQTDAAINPGNSGGPLCNIYGQVIGINSAKIADSDYEGMGFAIPSTTVKEVVDDLVKQGYVNGRVKIGITGTVSTQSYLYNNVPTGIQISEIIEDGPCDNGEIKVGDIICKLDNYTIKSFSDIYVALTNYKAGDEVTLTIYNTQTGEYYESEVILQADNGSTTAE